MANKKDSPSTEANTEALLEAEKILDEARKEAEKILSDAKEQAMKDAKPVPDSPKTSGEDLVTVYLQKDKDKYKDDVFIAVNGERVQVKRGKPVKIKRKFAEVLEQSIAQDTSTAELIEKETSRYKEAARLGTL